MGVASLVPHPEVLVNEFVQHRSRIVFPVMGVLFVAQSVTFAIFIVVFRRNDYKTMALWMMLGVILLMYTCSACILALLTSSCVLAKQGRMQIASSAFFTAFQLEYVLILTSDGIVVWRAWRLWRDSKVAGISACTLFVCTFVLTFINVASLWTPVLLMKTHMLHRIFLGATVLTNLYTTFLVGLKAWQYRKILRAQTGQSKLLLKIMILLCESGVAYSLYWGTYLVFMFVLGDVSLVLFYFNAAVPFVASTYPSIIFILCGLHKTAEEVFTVTDIDSVDAPDLISAQVLIELPPSTTSKMDLCMAGQSYESPGNSSHDAETSV